MRRKGERRGKESGKRRRERKGRKEDEKKHGKVVTNERVSNRQTDEDGGGRTETLKNMGEGLEERIETLKNKGEVLEERIETLKNKGEGLKEQGLNGQGHLNGGRIYLYRSGLINDENDI